MDLTNQAEVKAFFEAEKPEYVILAAAKVGGVIANNIYRGEFIYLNLMIQNNVIHHAYENGVKKLLFLGSTCIYPREAPQPMKEEYLLTGPLEYTNEPYAIAKIAGMKLCESYNIQYGTNFIAVMPTNLYGPNDNFDLEKSHVLPALLRKIHLGKCLENNDWNRIRKDLDTYPIEGTNGMKPKKEILQKLNKYGITQNDSQVRVEIWGTGTPMREFMYSENMAAACVFMMENVDIQQINSFTKEPIDPKDPTKDPFREHRDRPGDLHQGPCPENQKHSGLQGRYLFQHRKTRRHHAQTHQRRPSSRTRLQTRHRTGSRT